MSKESSTFSISRKDRMNIKYEDERRGSRSRALERSLSYSEAIGNGSESTIEIPRIVDTDVYTNEEIKKHYRISQTYFEGREIAFPFINIDDKSKEVKDLGYKYYSSEDEHTDDAGLVMTIDVETESPKSSDKRNISDASTQPLVGSVVSTDIYETIESADTIYNENETRIPSAAHTYSSIYTKRRKKSKRCR